MNDTRVFRDFVTVGGREVHYRYAGDGPPVILMHQSPRTSAELLPLIRYLAPRFSVIAPDTPGFGLSDPVAPPDAEPTIDAFCDAIAGFMDALGLARAAVFGSHTGAIIAVRFASRYPSRVQALVANGIMLTTADERREYAENYFRPFVPQWDGSHLAWLWSRLRDQLVFYPFYHRDPSRRINWEQSLEEIDAGALDLLQAGDNYRGGYQAVLAHDITADLRFLQVPTLLLVARPDALSRYVEHYPPLPEGAEVSVVPQFSDIPEATLQFFARHPDTSPAPRRPDRSALRGIAPGFVHRPGGSLHVLQSAGPATPPVLVLHDLGSSIVSLEAVLGGMTGRRRLVAPDLPGHGESDGFDATSPAAIAAVLLELLDALALPACDVVAVGASAAACLALSRLAPARVRRLALVEPLIVPPGAGEEFARRLLPDLAADIGGSHLARAWMYLRDRELFFPWHDRSAAGMLPLARPPRPVELQRDLLGLLRSYPGLAAQREAALQEATVEAVAGSGATLMATEGAACRRLDLPFVDLPWEKVQWGPAILRALA